MARRGGHLGGRERVPTCDRSKRIRVRVAMSVPSFPSLLAFLIPDARSIAYPPRSAWSHNLRLAYGVAKTPLGTHSSYLSRSRVSGQVVPHASHAAWDL